MNMIEKMAMEIGRRQQIQNYGKIAIKWEEYNEFYVKSLKEQAKAAITAIREPNESMIEAAFGKADNPHPFRTAWYAMIDDILKEE